MSRPKNSLSRRTFLGSTVPGASGAAVVLGAAGKLLWADMAPPPWKSVSDRKIRVGVVGGGFGASFPWLQHPNCVVEAVSDLQPDRRNGLMNTFLQEVLRVAGETRVGRQDRRRRRVYRRAQPRASRRPGHAAWQALLLGRARLQTLDDAHKLKEIKERPA